MRLEPFLVERTEPAQNVEQEKFKNLYLAVIVRALQDALSSVQTRHKEKAREFILNSDGFGSLSWFCEMAGINDSKIVRNFYLTRKDKKFFDSVSEIGMLRRAYQNQSTNIKNEEQRKVIR